MDDLTDIRDLYNAAWDVEETRLERHQLEADITWRYLDRHLPPSGRVLEIGSGTGAYTFPLARRGYRITAIDLAEEISPMHESVGFGTLQIAGVEPVISGHDEHYNRLAGKQRDLWLDLLLEVSGEQSMVASSMHLLYVGRKGH